MRCSAFLAYRVPNQHGDIDWDKPTGGILIPIEQARYVFDVLAQRYHCGPHEQLVVHEVVEPNRVLLAELLQRRWNDDMDDFIAWMRGQHGAA